MKVELTLPFGGDEKMSWEIRKLDKSEIIFQEIKIIARPIGILLFGADGVFKNHVRDQIINYVEHFGTIYEYNCVTRDGLENTADSFKQRQNVLVVMDNTTSRSPIDQHQASKKLKEYGARVVIGICTRHQPGSLSDDAAIETDLQIQFHLPTLHSLELDYLIIAHEE